MNTMSKWSTKPESDPDLHSLLQRWEDHGLPGACGTNGTRLSQAGSSGQLRNCHRSQWLPEKATRPSYSKSSVRTSH